MGGDRWNGPGLQTGEAGMIAGKAKTPAIAAPKEGAGNTGGKRISLPVCTVKKSVIPMGPGPPMLPPQRPSSSSGPVFARNVLQKGLLRFTPMTDWELEAGTAGLPIPVKNLPKTKGVRPRRSRGQMSED